MGYTARRKSRGSAGFFARRSGSVGGPGAVRRRRPLLCLVDLLDLPLQPPAVERGQAEPLALKPDLCRRRVQCGLFQKPSTRTASTSMPWMSD
jgi:hypothetical protein